MNRQHRLWWQSSYDRGLEHLLKMWPSIKEIHKDAELWITYGWDLFDKGYADNPERMKWKEKIDKLMEQEGITHFGRVGKEKLHELRSQCGIWAYPTHFGETNCIGALECQLDGVAPCVIHYAGLRETVGSGVRVEGDIYDPDTYMEYLDALTGLMSDEKHWSEEQKKGFEWAKEFSHEKIADKWIKEFEK